MNVWLGTPLQLILNAIECYNKQTKVGEHSYIKKLSLHVVLTCIKYTGITVYEKITFCVHTIESHIYITMTVLYLHLNITAIL